MRAHQRASHSGGQEMPEFPNHHLCESHGSLAHIQTFPEANGCNFARRPPAVTDPSVFTARRLAKEEPITMTGTTRPRLAFVGLQPGEWAARAHIPALRALYETFEMSVSPTRARAARSGMPPRPACRGIRTTSPNGAARSSHRHRRGKGPPSLRNREGGDRRGKQHLCEWTDRNGLARRRRCGAPRSQRSLGRSRNSGPRS